MSDEARSRAIHDRMPMILDPADYDAWLGNNPATDMLSLLKPYDEKQMKAYEVSRVVNSVKNDSEECVQPLQSSA